ncbi:hypothetical protein B0H15DRAFT_834530 [Mycena belliarum]|uniref:Uncharacterized protein n=1 Tax=Mycena belliarum TaxID=1033014 RepID=A0AAD6U6Y0_9AGAR|nr:hypothetical protein B0H15DRAFT_834530 [Mycena belliae]
MIVLASAPLARSRPTKGPTSQQNVVQDVQRKAGVAEPPASIIMHNRPPSTSFSKPSTRPLTPDSRVFATEYLNAGFDDVLARSTLTATRCRSRLRTSACGSRSALRCPRCCSGRCSTSVSGKLRGYRTPIRDVTMVDAGQFAASDMSRACPSARVVCPKCVLHSRLFLTYLLLT